MKLFILGAAALLAAPVMAQTSGSMGTSSPVDAANGKAPVPGAPGNMDNSGGQTNPGQTDPNAPPPPPADGSAPPPPPPADGAMMPPPPPPPGGGQIVMGPMNTTPPPAAVENPPVCKKGQTDDCIEPGARRARRR